jgi:citronellol/citronellal dehydrogenase
MTLKDKKIIITGGSRGIGRAIALKCAKDGAKVAIAAKTAEHHAYLSGTIYSVAEEIEALGGEALPLVCDVRDEKRILDVMDEVANRFGGLDIVINNASAISLTPTLETPIKRYDLMMAVNVRATFAVSQAAIPYLEQSDNAHILTLSPPLTMESKWFKDHLAYTMSKYGMSMCTLGLSEELKPKHIAVNSLWPKTTIATAAIEKHFPTEVYQCSRKEDIMADSAYWILNQDPRKVTGQFFIDETLLREAGVTDFDKYALNPDLPLFSDLFINER